MSKLNKRGGFTLAELLIVIAIMAILIAIAIPVFSAQLENARHAVDDSAARSAKSMGESHYLLCHAQDSRITDAAPLKVYFKIDSEDNMTLDYCSVGPASSGVTSTCDAATATTVTGTESALKAKCQCKEEDRQGSTSLDKGKSFTEAVLHVEVKPGGYVTDIWE